jgi:hypothetical protein
LRIVEQMRGLLQTFAVMAAMFAILAVGAGFYQPERRAQHPQYRRCAG